MPQARIKQIKGLESVLNAITGIDTIIETFSTNVPSGDTGIRLSNNSRETDNTKIYINGHLVSNSSYSWKKNDQIITTSALESGTELVWNSIVAGFELDETDEIQLIYETHSSLNSLENNPGIAGITGTVVGHLIPDTNETYDLGSPDKKFRDIYMSGNTLYMGGQPLSIVNGTLTLNGTPVTGSTDTKYSKGPTIGTNYPIYYKDFITDLYSIPSSGTGLNGAKYSKNEEMLVVIASNDIEFYQIDLSNNSSFLLTSIPRSSVMPNYKDNGQISGISYTGAFVHIVYRDLNNDYHNVILNLVGNQVNIIPNPDPIDNRYRPASHADYFINYDANNTSTLNPYNIDHIVKKWDGTNWIDYQVFSPNLVYGSTEVYSRVIYSSDNIVVLHVRPASAITPNHIYIVRFDGTNWNTEYNINNCLSAFVALSPNENTFIYVNENYEFFTLKYQSGSWNTINTMIIPSPGSTASCPLSVSVNEDRITLLDDIWQWDGSQWIKTETLVNEGGHATLYGDEYSNYDNGLIFSRSNNSSLIKFGNNTQKYLSASIFRITIPNNILQYAQYQFSYNMLASPKYQDARASLNLEQAEREFWLYINPGNPRTYDKETVEFVFEDTLSYVTGESVIMYSDNYELVLKMQVVNNDIPTKTLTLSNIRTLKEPDGNQPFFFTTYNIQPHS